MNGNSLGSNSGDFWKSFSFRPVLRFNVDFMVFVWLSLFYQTWDLYSFDCAMLSGITAFKSLTLLGIFCWSLLPRAVSAPRYIKRISHIRSSDPAFSILSIEKNLSIETSESERR